MFSVICDVSMIKKVFAFVIKNEYLSLINSLAISEYGIVSFEFVLILWDVKLSSSKLITNSSLSLPLSDCLNLYLKILVFFLETTKYMPSIIATPRNPIIKPTMTWLVKTQNKTTKIDNRWTNK